MISKLAAELRRRIPWIAAAGLVGGGAFVTAQVVAGFPSHIAEFMGTQIVRRGGYSESLAGILGWGVHFAVALSWATLYAVAITATPLPERRGPRFGAAAGIAVVFAWIATLLTAPAIATTISVLAGQGFPASLPGLNTSFGFPFWNHVGFFSIAWLLIVIVPALLASRATPDQTNPAEERNEPAVTSS